MKQIDTIIYGATALALPIAYSFGERCLVVESGYSAGAEFADALVATPTGVSEPETRLAARLRRELLDAGILSADGRIHILALGGLLAKHYLATGCHLLLGTIPVSQNLTSDGFAVELFNPEQGYLSYHAKTVIDTRVLGHMVFEKSFGLLLCGDSSLKKYDDGSAYLLHGRFDDEFILRLRVGRNATIPESELAADEYLAHNRDKLGRAKVAGIALAFGYRFASPLDFTRDGVRHIPSAAYPDVLSAVSGGERIWL